MEKMQTKKALSFEEANEILVFNESYGRLGQILSLCPMMEKKVWLRVLGEWWSGSDNIGEYRKELKSVLGAIGPIREMMEDHEQAAYNTLPEVITVYRGCGPANRIGASWSLDRKVAEKFPFLDRYRVSQPGLITGTVKKKNVLALKLDRDEQEIISFSVKEIQVDFICTNPLTNEPVEAYLTKHLLHR